MARSPTVRSVPRGIFGQYIYINPTQQLVVVTVLSARPRPRDRKSSPTTISSTAWWRSLEVGTGKRHCRWEWIASIKSSQSHGSLLLALAALAQPMVTLAQSETVEEVVVFGKDFVPPVNSSGTKTDTPPDRNTGVVVGDLARPAGFVGREQN